MRHKNRIRELRTLKGLTLDQLAEKTGYSLPQIQKLEVGERRLNEDNMRSIAAALDVPQQDLLEVPTGLSRGNLYKVDEPLMKEAAHAIEVSAQAMRTHLSLAQMMTCTVHLYNHVMEYRSQGKEAEPNEAMAALVLRQVNLQ